MKSQNTKKPQPRPPKSSPVLPPPPARLEERSALASMMHSEGPMSTVHFLVHPGMEEIQAEARRRGWLDLGHTHLTVNWLELRWTADGWKTTHVVSSDDVPCPVVNGTFHLTGCQPGTEVEFAIHCGIASHAPHDTAGAREVGDLWFNNGGQNYRQVTR